MKIRIKYLTLLLLLTMATTAVYGCDPEGNQPAAENAAPSEETPAEVPTETPAAEETPEANANEPAANDNNTQRPIAEKSPIAVTRINPDPVEYNNPTDTTNPMVSGSDDNSTDTNDATEEKDPHDHEPTPNLFPIDRCLVEVQGEYDSEFSKNMVTAINAARVDYMIPEVKRNTGLLACADIRCKEQAYFIGHFRPDGRSWRSVAPGYVQGECIAVDYRTAEDVVKAWLNSNETRVQLMNPDYTQVGTSVYNIDGVLYVAAEFGY